MWHDTTVSGEILIIGGGVVGLALGWRLRQEGARVSIVERGSCGRSAGWASAGLVQAMPGETAQAFFGSSFKRFFTIMKITKEMITKSMNAPAKSPTPNLMLPTVQVA